MEVIIGRNFTDPSVTIRSLTVDSGIVTIRGIISHLAIRDLAERQIHFIAFVVTDDTASVLCKAFIRNGKANTVQGSCSYEDTALQNIISRINEASYVKARGECVFDYSFQKNTLIIRDLIGFNEEACTFDSK